MIFISIAFYLQVDTRNFITNSLHPLNFDYYLDVRFIIRLCSAHAITADVSIAETAKAAEFFLSDGVIVTGAATAVPADLKDLLSVKKAVKIPVLIGKWLYIYYSTMTSP